MSVVFIWSVEILVFLSLVDVRIAVQISIITSMAYGERFTRRLTEASNFQFRQLEVEAIRSLVVLYP